MQGFSSISTTSLSSCFIAYPRIWYIYIFVEYGFLTGQGRSGNVIDTRSSCPDLAEPGRGETITAVECITADGWLMAALLVFKSNGFTFIKAWWDSR